MIDHRQIRAARALLNWSQADLARAADMATSSIKNTESESSSARRETLARIFEAFDSNGVEFLPGTGVRLKNHIVAVHEGKRATTELLDNIFQHASVSPDREVCIIGIDEAFSAEIDGTDHLLRHLDRLTKAGIRERVLVCEGDTCFIAATECYRWLPRAYFTRSSPIYIYGDRIAIHSGSLRRRTIIIEARPLAQHMRMIFSLLWDCVSTAPPPVAALARASG